MPKNSNTTKKRVRQPVIAVMGHIDHGKSTLIDYIRETNTTADEAGGITQHVSAYEVLHKSSEGKERMLTFLDTPGHEAFGGIRERGATAADIIILVVSAEDGVKPQTLEARDKIKASGLPYVVAINKVDLASANVEQTKQSLAENDIYVEGYGGDVPFVALSAKTGQGVDELLDMIALIDDLEPHEADVDTPGEGVIIESRLDPKQGIASTAIVKNGEVKKGMFAAAAGTVAPLRLILDTAGNQVEEIEAGRPVQIIGWSELPEAGSTFKTFLKKDEAEEYAESQLTTHDLQHTTLGEGVTALPLVVKADTAGSLEAVLGELAKLGLERIAPQIVLTGVGTISESDVRASQAAEGAVVLGFSVKADSRAKALAERAEVPIEIFNIIYELVDKVKALLVEREPRIEVEEVVGKAKIIRIFGVSKGKQVAGGRVEEGEIKVGAKVRIIRRGEEVGKGKIKGLQQSKVETQSVSEGNEFGAMIESKLDAAPGDILEATELVTK